MRFRYPVTLGLLNIITKNLIVSQVTIETIVLSPPVRLN